MIKWLRIYLTDEDSYNMLDATTGTTYYCFLYSKEKLDVEKIMTQIKSGSGEFWDRLNHSIGNKFVELNNIKYKGGNMIEFSALSSGKTVVPVVLEIPHN